MHSRSVRSESISSEGRAHVRRAHVPLCHASSMSRRSRLPRPTTRPSSISGARPSMIGTFSSAVIRKDDEGKVRVAKTESRSSTAPGRRRASRRHRRAGVPARADRQRDRRRGPSRSSSAACARGICHGDLKELSRGLEAGAAAVIVIRRVEARGAAREGHGAREQADGQAARCRAPTSSSANAGSRQGGCVGLGGRAPEGRLFQCGPTPTWARSARGGGSSYPRRRCGERTASWGGAMSAMTLGGFVGRRAALAAASTAALAFPMAAGTHAQIRSVPGWTPSLSPNQRARASCSSDDAQRRRSS